MKILCARRSVLDENVEQLLSDPMRELLEGISRIKEWDISTCR